MKVAKIFYSLQGEGCHSGRAAVFIRFHGCNLNCSFCDEPLHKGEFQEMTAREIIEAVQSYPAKLAVLTGGEPSLFDLNPLIERLRFRSYKVAVETNGHRPENIIQADWIAYSPKRWDQINPDLFYDEMKLVVDKDSDERLISRIAAQTEKPVYLQPKADPDGINMENIDFCAQIIKRNPRLRLSLQIHKFINIE